MPREDELEKAVLAGDRRSTVGALRGASGSERKAIAPLVLELCRRVYTQGNNLAPELRARMQASACAAAFAVLPWPEIQKRGEDLLPWDEDLIAVMLDRRPPWSGRLAAWLGTARRIERWWTVLRVLEREGMVEVPRSPRYWTSMADRISSIWLRGALLADPDPRQDGPPAEALRTTVDALRRDRAMLEHDLWRMLEHDVAVEVVLVNRRRSPHLGPDLDEALVQLVAEGVVSRARVIESALEGLARATPKTQRWFRELLETLEPTLDDQAV